ncbi:MAG TPA: ATP-binding protein [Candidatus Limnocylindria bacterium]|nr:ATP-binding protein [Candidatus Limnocylindria bacterium]
MATAAEGFPATPSVSWRVRAVALVIGLVLLALAVHTIALSLRWVGATFPGFLLLDNRVVASIGLPRWSGSQVDGLRQAQVTAVDGVPMASTQEIYRTVAARPPGSPLRYTIVRFGEASDVTLRSQRFDGTDWMLLFGALLLNGLVFLASGLVVWVLRPRAPVSLAFLVFGVAYAVWMFTSLDLYGPAVYFRLHVIGETLVPAASLHLVLTFPRPHRWVRWTVLPYLASLVVLWVYEAHLYDPPVYSRIIVLNYTSIGVAALLFLARQVVERVQSDSPLTRSRTWILMIGTVLGLALPGAYLAMSAATAADIPLNLAAFNFLFPLCLAYAIIQHDLFEIDAMVKRAAYYLVLSGAVGAAYVAAVVVFNLVLRAGAVTDSPVFPVVFTLAVLLFFNPIRSRLQSFVDRVFYRTRYDSAQLLAQAGSELSSALTRDAIGALVRRTVDEAIPNPGARLFVSQGGGEPVEIGGEAVMPAELARWLAAGRVLTAFDSPEAYPSAEDHDAVRRALGALGAEVAVPLQYRGELRGALLVGPKRSGLFYTAGDAQFLRALAHQAAIALENARTYEALVELNASLEQRVQERTMQLVQSEKMASLGRLVAGVAHEINNPVSFISSAIPALQKRLGKARAQASPEIGALLGEADELVGVMARGAERTATIVKDLRTFSRLQEAVRKPSDLNEGLEVSLRLLESQWRDRITVHRSFGTLPLVECDAGQINQVFMNVLANACEAIAGAGNIWVTTRDQSGQVVIEIRDDGRGIPPEVLPRIFDPFFTTKEVGQGTGLGLAISQGIVAAHHGRLEVQSEAGGGTTFRIVLPVAGAESSLDKAATGG